MLIGSVPNLASDRRRIVEIHTHSLLLTSLASEDVGRDGLLHFGLSNKHLIFCLNLEGLHLDDLPTRNHSDVMKNGLNIIVGQNHADERAREGAHTANIVLRSPGLYERAH